MTATLWLDTEKEETIELGGTMQLYRAFADMAHAAGPAAYEDYPDLFGVVTQVETQEDADPEWLADARKQAAVFLSRHGEALTPDARAVLVSLAGEGVRMSLDSPSRILDALIEQGAPAALALSERVREEVRELAKKKYPKPS